MQQIILIFHVLFAICVVTLVLLQHGKGADIGATFGSGSANTMFGSVGPAPFLMKVTAILGALFFVTSLTLSYLVGQAQRDANTLNMPLPTNTSQPLNKTP